MARYCTTAWPSIRWKAAMEQPTALPANLHSGVTNALAPEAPDADASPIMAVSENPYLDPFTNSKRIVISDEEVEHLEGQYVKAAQLAHEIGFDAVDIKACHRCLISELLSAHTRKGSSGRLLHFRGKGH